MTHEVNVNHRNELIKLIRQLSQKYSIWRVFEDFLAMSAISISNAVDWLHRDEREAEYMKIVDRYDRKDLELFPQMLAHLVEELERHADAPDDILGWIYHELELHNKYKGQFFTPQNVCDMMGMISLGENDIAIAEKGYLSVAEPCAGSGAMILGFVKAMIDNKFDYHRQMVVTATDVDLKCAHMCYLQLSLYGIPAVVIHGNSLTLQEYSRWYTPVYMLDGWVWRQTCGNLDRRYPEDEAIKRASDPMYAAIRDAEALMSANVNESEKSVSEPLSTVTVAPVYDVKLREADNGQSSLDF